MEGFGPASRRAFLTGLMAAAAPGAEKRTPATLPTERKRYADPLTEFEVIRLTEPNYTSFLPPAHQRPISRRGGFLLYASDRAGTMQILRMDLKSGASQVLTSAAALAPHTLSLTADERTVFFADGRWVCALRLAGRAVRRIYQAPANISALHAAEGNQLLVVENSGDASRLRLAHQGRTGATTLLEVHGQISDPLFRLKRPLILYRRDNSSLWLLNPDGKQHRRLNTPEGAITRAHFSPDGRTVLYLHAPPDKSKLPSIREIDIESGEDRQIAVTSRFIDFAPNPDASVFVGVSGSIAQPSILLLVRAVRRELTLCEHRATDAASVHAQLSPNSQRMFFQSDRHGKPALYMMNIERLVEKTETE